MTSAAQPREHRRHFAELSVEAVQTRITESSILVLPVGSTEAHGPHLPLSTDFDIACAAVDAVVARAGERLDLWALPPLAFTKSNEHAWAPGTVWLSATTMLAVLDDLGRSLATTKARTLVFVNGHGGNSALLQVASRDLRLAYGFKTFVAHPFASSNHDSEHGMPIHGGHDETSILMHLRPELVDMSKARRAVPEHIARNRYVKWGGSVTFGWLSSDFEPEPAPGELPLGLIGDPTSANAADGAELWQRVIDELVGAFDEIAVWNPSGS